MMQHRKKYQKVYLKFYPDELEKQKQSDVLNIVRIAAQDRLYIHTRTCK